MKQKKTPLYVPLVVKLIFTLVPLLVLFSIAMGVFHRETREILSNSVMETSSHNFDLIAAEWNTTMESVANETVRTASSSTVRNYLQAESDATDAGSLKTAASSELFYTIINSTCMQSAFLIKDAEDYIARCPYRYDSGEQLVNVILNQRMPSAGFVCIKTKHDVYFCIIQKISGFESAYLCMVIRPDYAKALVNKYAGMDIAYSISDLTGGSILYATENQTGDYQEQLIGDSGRVETDDCFLIYQTLENSTYRLLATISKEKIYSEIDKLRSFLFAATIMTCVIMVIVLIWLFTSFVSHIRVMTSTMKEVSTGNYNARCDLPSNDEIGILGRHLDEMLDNLQALVIETSLREVALKRAELSAVKSQSSPHFLYNALETIRMIALRNGDQEVPDIIKQLSLLLRYCTEQEEWVRVRDEVEQIERYLDLQKMRFKNKFSSEVYIDQTILDFRIPRLLLQPLVENAFKHGVEPSLSHNVLKMYGGAYGSGMEFIIFDSGVGMASEVLETITAYIAGQGDPTDRLGIGLKGVIDRLRLYYSGAAEITVESHQNEGTRIHLFIPEYKLKGGHSNAYSHSN